MRKFLVFIFGSISVMSLASCSNAPAHEHTFSDEWSKNETSHWHAATCEHTDLTSKLGEHTYGGDGKCTVCGYSKPLNKYLVTFDTNYGSYVAPEIVLEGSSATRPDNPDRDGYAFFGWYNNSDFTGEMFDFNTKISSNLTLYARWGYSFVCFNHDGSIFHDEVLAEGEIIKPVSDPTKENETFIGWYEDPSFEGEKFTFNTEIHKNTAVYASFGFSINFYTHDGSLFKNVVVPEGKKLEKPESPAKEFYDFDDWYTDGQFTEKYNFNQVVTSEFNLFANFTPSYYSIVYHNCESATNPNPAKYQYTVGLSSLADASKNGYRFYGWYSDETLTQKVTSIAADRHETVHLYAYFSVEYKVTFTNWPSDIPNLNPTSFTVEEREDLDLNPFKDYPGFTFISYTDSEGISRASTNVDHDLELKVNYSSTTTRVTFDANGGGVIGLENSIYLCYNIPNVSPELFSVPASTDTSTPGFNPNREVPRYEGHVFKGWYLDEELTTPIEKDSTTLVVSGQTLYAKWEEIPSDYGDIYTGISYDPGWQHRPYSFTKGDGVFVPYNVKELDITYFASCMDGTAFIASNGRYSGTRTWHQIFRSTPNVDYIIESLKYDCSGDEEISFSVSLTYDNSKFDECLPKYSYSFNVLSYREEYIKVGPASSVSMDINYWEGTELPYIGREGYTFDGWYKGDKLVDVSGHFVLTDEAVTLVAHWTKND